jgi:hypothetical protein
MILLLIPILFLATGNADSALTNPTLDQKTNVSTNETRRIVERFVEDLKQGKAHDAIWNLPARYDLLDDNMREKMLDIESRFDIIHKTRGRFLGYDIVSNAQIGSSILLSSLFLYYEKVPVYVTIAFANTPKGILLYNLNLDTDNNVIIDALKRYGSTAITKSYDCIDGNIPKIIDALKNCDIEKLREFLPNSSQEQLNKFAKTLKDFGKLEDITTLCYKEFPNRMHNAVYLLSYSDASLFTHIYEYKTDGKWVSISLDCSTEVPQFLNYLLEYSKEESKRTK